MAEINFVYILRCADDSFYTGWTTDPEKRLKAHQSGKGSKYTRSRLPVEMVYLECFPDKTAALRREAAIKKMSRNEKMEFVSQGPTIRCANSSCETP